MVSIFFKKFLLFSLHLLNGLVFTLTMRCVASIQQGQFAFQIVVRVTILKITHFFKV